MRSFLHISLTCGLLVIGTSLLAADPEHFRGEVVRTDPASGKLVLSNLRERDVTFQANSESQIAINGRPAKLDDLKPNQRVRVTYDKNADGTRQILTLRPALGSDRQIADMVRNSYQRLKDYTYENKDEVKARLREVADHVDDRIDRLEQELESADSEAAKQSLQTRIADLKKHRASLQVRMNKIGDATADAWEDFKDGTSDAFEELEKLFNSKR